MLFTAVCPLGYFFQIGAYIEDYNDYNDAPLMQDITATLHECAVRCDRNPECLSFEHSSTQSKCNLEKQPNTNQQEPNADYVFCSKTGDT